MNLISIENLSKSYGDRILFENVTIGLDEGDKVGLIGVNGTGKSTFLKVITGFEPPDNGKITKGSTVRVEYLPQNPEFDPEATVLAQVFKGDSPEMRVLSAYEHTLAQLEINPENTDEQTKLISLSQQMDAQNIWQMESEAKIILTKLGVTDFSARVGNMSGGQRKRIALASALITPADVLILDEPTNHIDNDMVMWLEQYLAKRKGALLMITHDRYFLDRVVSRIIEIDKGKLYSYTGNYSQFLELKLEREEQAESSERKRQNLLRNELAWIRRGAQARSTKQKARIERFQTISQQNTDISDSKLEIQAGSSRLGRKIIELESIKQGFDNRVLINDFSYIVLKNDRVGIVGPNGSGKSTLLNIIVGKIAPDQGMVDIGQTVKLGYFSQESREMDESLRVIDYIKEEANFITTMDGTVISASQLLERFLFGSNLQWNPIAKLSGGERRRLFLLRILMGSPNVLLLDEPTNDLDIATLTILEDYLETFPGAVITVSHDRYFLDRIADKIFAFEGNGVITQYIGGYSAYQDNRRLPEAEPSPKPQKAGNDTDNKPTSAKQPRKFTFKEQREYEQIDDIIASVEETLAEIQRRINTAGSNFELLQQLTSEEQQLKEKLDTLLERWTYLNELAEEIDNAL
ncbi:MAG: ettA [Firmicutes bacterium]|nr:ettA [Bacillota bacterium]